MERIHEATHVPCNNLRCLSLLVLSPVAAGPAGPSTVPISPQPSRQNLAFGNPTEATAQVTNGNNFLMIKPQFALSYNNYKGGPNWVSWHLEDGDVGAAQRLNRFHHDDQLPLGFKRIVTGLYTNTGYERGHLCNSEDRTRTPADNLATFAMTNILPQKEDSNKGPWFALEKFGRKLVSQGNELYIVAGAFGTKGSFGPTERKVKHSADFLENYSSTAER